MKNYSNKTGSNFFVEVGSSVKRAFEEFLTVPTIVVFCFLALAAGSNLLERGNITWIKPFMAFMQQHFFSDSKATSDLLAAIGGSIITVSSLTITLLLIVVQQSAASMTTQVFDQFLRSRNNQLIFGFFVGLALFSLIILASVSPPFNPVIGATIALFLTLIALFLLLILVYTTINEMRPPVIIESIYHHIIKARVKQTPLISNTRRSSEFEGNIEIPVKLVKHGYLININLKQIEKAAKNINGKVEIIFQISVGDFIAMHDVMAIVKGNTAEDCEKMCEAVSDATLIELQRNTGVDPADGIEQLEMIAWTSISTSKSNPYPGLLAIRALRNLLSQWKDEKPEIDHFVYPVVYYDNVKGKILDTLETLGIVASESMQHQSFMEVLRTFTILYNRVEPEIQQRIEDIILRLLSAMGDFVLSAPLDQELSKLISVLNNNKRFETADAISIAQSQLQLSLGKLNSRASRTEG